jgi:hypothetical protein
MKKYSADDSIAPSADPAPVTGGEAVMGVLELEAGSTKYPR